MTSASKKRRRRKERDKRTQDLLQRARAISLVDVVSPPPTEETSSEVLRKAKQMKYSPKDLSQTYKLLQQRPTANSITTNPPQEQETSWKRVEFVLPRANGKKRFVFERQANAIQNPEDGTIPNESKNKTKSSETIDDILFADKRHKENTPDEAPDEDANSRKKAKPIGKEEEIITETRRRKLSDAFEAAHQEDSKPKISNFVEMPKDANADEKDFSSPVEELAVTIDASSLSQSQTNSTLPNPETSSKSEKRSAEKEVNQTFQATPSGQITGRTVKEAVRDKRGLRPRANSTDGELNLPRGGLCDERMILEAHKWASDKMHTKPIPPRGFHNLGNTCFLNATLQCLTYLPPLCQTLLAISKNKMRNGKNGKKIPQGQKITSSLCSLFQQAHGLNNNATKTGGAFAPKKVVNHLPNIGSCGSRNGYKFRPGRQEDAHEFLVHLLDAMNDGELRAAGINQNISGWRDRLPVSRLDETTFVHRIFGGYFRSQVRCRRCNYRSNTYDPFLDLSLEVSKKSSTSVLKALSEFTRKETLDAANQWKCSGCKKYVCATKQLTVFRPPLSLCIQLKRFAFDTFGFGHKYSKYQHGYGGGGSKITKPIEFPGTLNLPLSDNRSCQYTLTGVVIHVGGSSQSGHYTAYVKKPGKSGVTQWYHMDDSEVQPVSERTVLKQRDAYLLFYCRTEVKLEFPDPPARSMSASEATEFGRNRARARSESFTAEMKIAKAQWKEITNDDDMISKQSVDVSSEIDATDLQKKNNSTKSPSDSRKDDDDDEGTSNGSKKSSEKQVASSFKGRPSEPKESSSSESDSDSDSASGKNTKAANKKNSPTVFAKASSKDDEASSSGSESNSEDESSRNTHKAMQGNSDVVESSTKSSDDEEKPSVFETKSESRKISVANDDPKATDTDVAEQTPHPKESAAAKRAAKTTVVVNNTDSRGKVKVMLGPRKRKLWESKASAITQKGTDFQLLGNLKVSQWGDDDEHDDGENNEAAKSSNGTADQSEVRRQRKTIVEKIEKQSRARKRKMHLDRWDSHLDQGRQKKIKGPKPSTAHEASSAAPKKNVFQRIQSSVQRMGRGKPKGLLRRRMNKKKRKYEI